MSNTKKATAKTPPTLDDIIAQATPAERIVRVCVAGNLVAEYQQLEHELEQAQTEDLEQSRLNKAGSARKIAERIRKLEEQMRQHTHTFRFRAVSPRAWSDLLAAHTPREGKQERVFNVDTFPPAAIAACCVEPEGMDDVEAVKRLLEVLSPAQQSDLFDGAWDVNTQAPKDMTSYAASEVLANSETSSDTASRLGSPGPSS